jgi:hypothetical protein
MSKSLAALQKALNTKAAPLPVVSAAVVAAAEPVVAAAPGGSYMAPSRTGKANITAYLSPDYKRNLRLIQARTGRSLQSIIAEALNDVFQKYDVPTIIGE